MRRIGATTAALAAAAFAATPSAARADDAPEPLRGRVGAGACDTTVNDCFTLLAVQIEGAHAIPAAELADAYEPALAQAVSLQDIARIAQVMTDRYRAQGYFLSRASVPAQSFAAGIARIRMIEGRIASVVLEGDGADLVAPYFEGLDAAPVAALGDIDRRLARAGDAPGISLRSRIEPDVDDPSRHRLIVHAELKRFSAFASLDNRGSDRVGPWQAYGQAAWNPLLLPRDQAALSFFGSPFDIREFALVEARYGRALENGAFASATASVSRAHDGANAGTSDIGGEGETLSLQYAHPLIRRRDAALWLSGAFDARRSQYDWMSGGAFADETRVVRVALRGFLSDDGRASSVLAAFSLGVDVLGASSANPARRSRFDADAQFGKLNVRLTHFEPIGRWFALYAAVDGQVTDGPLLSSEEFSVGGLPYGRGYDYGEMSGDDGVAGVLEFRVGADPGVPGVSFAQGYVFVDSAQVWNYNTPPSADELSLSSAGVGMRLTFADWLTAQVEAARPLTRTPTLEGDKDWRPFVTLSANY